MKRRCSGILQHISSLPSPFGIGDLGRGAYRFADFLYETNQSVWQVLPLTPTEGFYHHSPYHSTSSLACNTLFISPELLSQEGLLSQSDLETAGEDHPEKTNYAGVVDVKTRMFDRAYHEFKKISDARFEAFNEDNAEWLDDYALFCSLKKHFGGKAWFDWPGDIRNRDQAALNSYRKKLSDEIGREKFLQYMFWKQWKNLKTYCNEKGIHIIGDLPIYVDHDSVDVWTEPQFFKLDENKHPYVVSGVPPDYFSSTGQLWGNPVYDWESLRKDDYGWWVKRMKRNLALCDFVRIDHFRGLVAYWEVPAGEQTAVNGKWIKAPVYDFFNRLMKVFPNMPVIAEDLGTITPDVKLVMRHFELPGMKVLLFAFGADDPHHPYLPHNYKENFVVYTGTHDNNTIKGWYDNEAGDQEKKRLLDYIGCHFDRKQLHWELIRLAMRSVAHTAVFPLQDVLGLGQECRMNKPGTADDNWIWRMKKDAVTPEAKERLREMTWKYGRA